MRRARIALDFDGTIHGYSRGWHDGTCYDPPMPGAFDAMQRFWDAGYDIVIFSCRVKGASLLPRVGRGLDVTPGHEVPYTDAQEIADWIEKWRAGHTFEVAEITGAKPVAELYIDDRGMHFDEQVGWQGIADRALDRVAQTVRELPTPRAEGRVRRLNPATGRFEWVRDDAPSSTVPTEEPK